MTKIDSVFKRYLGFLFGVILLIQCQSKSPYEVEVLNFGEASYGYQINLHGKLFIKQEYMPAVACKKYFKTEKQAESIANLMIDKMERKESPTIQLSELIHLGIDTNCVALSNQ